MLVAPLAGADDYAYKAAAWTTAYTTTVNSVVTATQLGHDPAGRLTQWTGQLHGPESWAYDPNGNIISNTGFISDAIRTTVFTYSGTIPNEVLQAQHTSGLGVESRTYDGHGNTTSIASTGGVKCRARRCYYPFWNHARAFSLSANQAVGKIAGPSTASEPPASIVLGAPAGTTKANFRMPAAP